MSKMDTFNILSFKSEPEEEAGKKSKLTCISDFQIFIVLYFAFYVYTMNLSKSVVITIFHLFELLNAEMLYIFQAKANCQLFQRLWTSGLDIFRGEYFPNLRSYLCWILCVISDILCPFWRWCTYMLGFVVVSIHSW